jgi:hypothetical protein
LTKVNQSLGHMWIAIPLAARRTTRAERSWYWLKQGHTLFLEGVDTANSPINQSLPLRGFADAYDGPGNEPRVLEELTLSQKNREQKRRDEEARQARCAATPFR